MTEKDIMDNASSEYLQTVLDKCKKVFRYIVLFSCAINIFILTVPLYLLQLYSRVLASKSYETLAYLTLIALIAVAVMGILEAIRSRMLQFIGTWSGSKLSPPALKEAVDELVHSNKYGVQCLQDIELLRRFLGGQGIIALLDAPWTIIFIIVIFLIHPILGGIALIGAGILIGLSLYNRSSTRVDISEANSKSVQTQRNIDTTTRNAEAIVAMGMIDNIVARWSSQQEEIRGLEKHASQRSTLVRGMSKFFRAGLQITMLCVGAILVLQYEINAGSMIVASILLGRALAPVEMAIAQWSMIHSSRDAYRRLKKHLSRKSRPVTSVNLPIPKGKISIEDLVYGLPKQSTPLLDHIFWTIPPGEVVILIGLSGVGKSTLAKLLMGIYAPQKGVVRLDGADVYQWERVDFGRHVGYLPQDIELFPGTIKENIARMGEPKDAAVVAAAQQALVHELILGFPEGYDTEIETKGFRLSGGQRQRIALARALYNNPQFIVLDEPNSNLDEAGDKALYKTVSALKKRGATVVIISHKKHLQALADQVLTLWKGKLHALTPRRKKDE